MQTFEEKYVKSRSNLHHVPIEKWKEWSPQARQVFNEVYSSMRLNQWIYIHPKQEPLPSKKHWDTTCWNAAWCAASAMGR